MIVPRLELQQILKGEVGETSVPDDPPAIGATCWVRESPRLLPPCRARVMDVWPVKAGFSVLLERADESFAAPAREPPQRPPLKLTRTQRMKLFDGECPHIGGRGLPPVKAGEMLKLSAKVTLNVLRVDVKAGRWKLHYELRDTRDPVRLLRKTPPAHREGGEYEHPTAAAIAEASEQSHYTSSPVAAVADAGEAPRKVWLDVRAKAISEFAHQRRLAQQAQQLRERSKAKRKRAA